MIGSARHHRSAVHRTAWIVAGAAGVALLVSVSFVRETLRSRQIDQQIAALKTESESLRARNLQIASLNTSLGAGEFLEREARVKLNLQKEGEHVVVIQKDAPPVRQALDDPQAELAKLSVPARWWLYFIDHAAYESYAAAARQ